jgi:sulfite reductase beta subunit-like hemoprotein
LALEREEEKAVNQIEAIKRHKDGLDVLGDIRRYAALGRTTIDPDDEALFKWYGVYTQRPADDGYFMVRLRIPGGDLTSAQLREIAALSEEYGRGLADITVRQNVQFHWVRIENIPDIFDRLQSVGLSTTEACGDCVRNIVNCPVSGVDERELFDATPLVRRINDFFVGNRDFSNLPRKFKIAITGCAVRCVYPEINDIGLFAVEDPDRDGVAFRARVGGGLSTAPRFAKDLGVLVEPDEVVELCAAVAAVFRDEGDRDNRKKARMKFLVEKWEIPRFRAEVESRLGRTLRRAPQADAPPLLERDRTHLGIHRQRGEGLYFAGVSLVGGRTSAHALFRLADLAERYGSGRVRTTISQSALLLDIAESGLAGLLRALDRDGLQYRPGWAHKGVIACTGTQCCKLAVSETKNRALELVEYLERAVKLDEPVRISVTGCPNSCGQHHVCDIGLEGSVTTVGGAKHEAFQVFLGGGVGERESFGRRIGLRIPAEALAESLARLLNRFKTERRTDEHFQAFCMRHSNDQLVEFITREPESIETWIDTAPLPDRAAALASARTLHFLDADEM